MPNSPGKIGLISALLLPITVGCSSSRIDLVRMNRVALEQEVPKGVRLSGTSVYEENGALVVSGSVWRERGTSGILRGHVDVVIVSPQGQPFSRTSHPVTPFDIPAKQPARSQFFVHLPTVPPDGSLVRVKYCLASHSVSR